METEGQSVLDENSNAGNDMLSDLCRDWEDASSAAKNAGINVIHLRTGIVMSPLGGALAKLLLPAKWAQVALLAVGSRCSLGFP